MSIIEKQNGDTLGTLVCPHCKKWVCLTAETFEAHKRKLMKK